MKLIFFILILSTCSIGLLAVKKPTDECFIELNMPSYYRELLEPGSLCLSLREYDEEFVVLLHCILIKLGAIIDGVVQPETLAHIINEVFEYDDDDVIAAINKCKSIKGEDSIDTMYLVSACLENELD